MHFSIEDQPIAVVGATGHTGRFVVRALQRSGARAVPLGRSDTASAAAIDRAFAGCAAAINCAGPFLDTALAVAEAALRAKIPYLDVTAEQGAVQSVIALDERAKAAGVVLVPAAAFFGGLADLLATAAARDAGAIEEIAVAVALDSWHPTRGTRVTGARNTLPRLIVRDGELVPLPQPAATRTWLFPDPFGVQEMSMLPLSETITLFHHLSARNVVSWINQRALRDVHDAATPSPQPSDERGRSSQTFVMDVLVRTSTGERRATATGNDIYAVSAPIVAGAARALVAKQSAAAPGVRSLAQAVDATAFLEALERDGDLRLSGPCFSNARRA